MLGMHINQLFAQFFHLCQRSRSIVNESPALARRLHFTTKNTFVLKLQFILFKKRFHTIGRNIKTSFYNTLRCPLTDSLHISPLP